MAFFFDQERIEFHTSLKSHTV